MFRIVRVLLTCILLFLKWYDVVGFIQNIPPPSKIPTSIPRYSETQSSSSKSSLNSSAETVLVVGATGRVGRRIVEELLAANKPVRALVRNKEKFQEIFGNEIVNNNSNSSKNLDVIVCDLGQVAKDGDPNGILKKAVQGCKSIISVSGCLRYSQWMDFVLPWQRIFQFDASQWDADSSHPYFGNYKAQIMLIDLAKQNNITRFFRLTSLSSGYSAFHPVSMIFGSIISLSNRYHFKCEEYLRNSNVPYLILRPGKLENEDRDPKKANLQTDPSGSLPAPARVARSDIVSLAIASCVDDKLPVHKSYTLAVRGVGEVSGKIQGDIHTNDFCYETVDECLNAVQNYEDTIDKTPKSKPYGLAVCMFVYSLFAITLKVSSMIFMGIFTLMRHLIQ